MVILAAAAFAVRSKYHMKKVKSPGQLFYGRDMKLPINNVDNWSYMRQRIQAQIDQDVICENTTTIDRYYRVGDKFMTKTKSAYK